MDYRKIAGDLERLLRLRAIPFGMKLYESVAEVEVIPKIRRAKGSVHTLDQIVAQAARLGWTVGFTTDDPVGDQCRSVVGLGGQNEKWHPGPHMVGVWYATPHGCFGAPEGDENGAGRQYKALVVAPLASGHLDPPDIALFYATPGAMLGQVS